MSDITPAPIIILNWNNFSDTKACIDSVLEFFDDDFEIHLIDNNSDEKELKLLKGEYDNHTIVKTYFNNSNLGFTKAHNQLIQELLKESHKYIFLLNNDTIINEDALKRLKKINFSDEFGMLSCKMINYWDRELIDSAGHKMLASGEIIPIGHGDSISKYNHEAENIGACAGAAIYSTKMLKDIGFFDEYFETGYEDAELGLRAFIAGYHCIYEPKAAVYHKMGQSIKNIFDYHYTLKIQTNIFYTYLKLVHWQVIAINFIPWMLRFIFITFIDILFWRPKYLKVQYQALYIIFFKDWKIVMKARKESKHLRRISWWKLFKKQEFFLFNDIRNFYKFIIKGEKSYFENF